MADVSSAPPEPLAVRRFLELFCLRERLYALANSGALGPDPGGLVTRLRDAHNAARYHESSEGARNALAVGERMRRDARDGALL